ncbi:MAG: L-aspartate oxidase [Flavobacteriales bacterium]|jgi:L-aspartate oxidase|nr:L-aspartate oxidase [Flavobacteriales bacterium]
MKPLEVIVVGGGIAGMACAVALIEPAEGRPLRIRVLTKAPVAGSSSYAAQGGVAVVMGDGDTVKIHVEDTIRVGAGRNDREVVERVVREGPAVIDWLQRMGARFDHDADGKLHLAREGGHSRARVLHHRDRTGEEIVRVLRERLGALTGVQLMQGHRAVDLIIEVEGQSRRCVGVQAIDLSSGDLMEHRADLVVLATGGVGQVYERTTNPAEATGDGVAMAVRADLPLRDMAFVQFHPTALHTGGSGQVPLISEAVRGAGARLIGGNGLPLMDRVHPAKDLAPRHVVARAIEMTMKHSGMQHVWLDASSIGPARFAAEFPAIERECRAHGIAPGRDLIPVSPAAHYLCGGIATDDQGRSSLPGLIAIGECAGSGLHGADRLASNSLLEALVIPRRAANAWLRETHGEHVASKRCIAQSKLSRRAPEAAMRAIASIRHAMSAHAGIIRDLEGLEAALRTIARCERAIAAMWQRRRWSLPLIEARDLAAVSRAVIEAALAQPVSIGTHQISERAESTEIINWLTGTAHRTARDGR